MAACSCIPSSTRLGGIVLGGGQVFQKEKKVANFVTSLRRVNRA